MCFEVFRRETSNASEDSTYATALQMLRSIHGEITSLI